MKKHLFCALALMAAFVMMWVALPAATASVTGDACNSGDHIYEFLDRDDSYYGALRYFDVEECEYASYEHQHYFVQSGSWLRYCCKVCGYVKTVLVLHDDTDLGEICMVSFNGR